MKKAFCRCSTLSLCVFRSQHGKFTGFPPPERQPAQWRLRSCHVNAGCALEVIARTSYHGLASKENPPCRCSGLPSCIGRSHPAQHLGWRQKLRACHARAPCHAGCDRPMHYERALHWKEACLLGRKTVVQRTSYDLQRAAGIHVARAHAPLRWLSLGRWQITRAYRTRLRCRVGHRPTRYGRELHR